MLEINAHKELLLVVRPLNAEAILKVLLEHGIEVVTIREAKGFGRQKGYLDRYRGSEYSMAYLPKVEITAWVPEADWDAVVLAVAKAGRTGRIGDGKVLVVPTAWPHAIEF